MAMNAGANSSGVRRMRLDAEKRPIRLFLRDDAINAFSPIDPLRWIEFSMLTGRSLLRCLTTDSNSSRPRDFKTEIRLPQQSPQRGTRIELSTERHCLQAIERLRGNDQLHFRLLRVGNERGRQRLRRNVEADLSIFLDQLLRMSRASRGYKHCRYGKQECRHRTGPSCDAAENRTALMQIQEVLTRSPPQGGDIFDRDA